MKKWIEIELACSNHEVLKTCSAAFTDSDILGGIACEDGDTEIEITMFHLPLQEILEISKRFPRDLINIRYSGGPHGQAHEHVIEIRNGKEINIKTETYYMFPKFLLCDEDFTKAICEKAEAFFNSIDTAEIGKEGNLLIDWDTDVVCYTYAHDADGTKFKIEATKYQHQIKLRIYAGEAKYTWREISGITHDDFFGNPIFIEQQHRNSKEDLI